MTDIFTPLQIKGKTLKNRIVMGAAERVGFTYEDGLMGEDVIQEYEALAQNNIGLMITQSLVISPEDIVAADFRFREFINPNMSHRLRESLPAAIKRFCIDCPLACNSVFARWSTKDI